MAFRILEQDGLPNGGTPSNGGDDMVTFHGMKEIIDGQDPVRVPRDARDPFRGLRSGQEVTLHSLKEIDDMDPVGGTSGIQNEKNTFNATEADLSGVEIEGPIGGLLGEDLDRGPPNAKGLIDGPPGNE